MNFNLFIWTIAICIVSFASNSHQQDTNQTTTCLSSSLLTGTQNRITNQIRRRMTDGFRASIQINPFDGGLSSRKYISDVIQNLTELVQTGFRDEIRNQFQQISTCLIGCSGTGQQFNSSCQTTDQLTNEMMKIAEDDLFNPLNSTLNNIQTEILSKPIYALPGYLLSQTRQLTEQTADGFNKMYDDLNKFQTDVQKNCCISAPNPTTLITLTKAAAHFA